MNLGVVLATFALVIPAELPDKTFISTLMMAARHQALPVWIGGAAALIVQALLAVVAGGLLALLPHTALQSVVAALFIAGALVLLFVPERHEQERASEITEGEERKRPASTGLRVALTTFAVVGLAEFGDITQVLIANLAARYHAAVSVFVGASLAFVLISGIGVVSGRTIIRFVPLDIVRRISGLIMLGLGIYSIVELL